MATNELERGVPNGRYKKLEAELRTELIAAQEQLQQARFPTLIVLGGFAGAGTSEASNALRQWMDSHGIAVCAFEPPSAEERERPEYWRYWLSLPLKGTIGIYLNGWYDRPLRDLAHGRSDEAAFDRDSDHIEAFENALVVDGALLIKLWIHLDKEARQQRIADSEQNPLTRWRVNADAREGLKYYDEFKRAADRLLQKTNIRDAHWQVVEGSDPHSMLVVGRAVRDAISQRLAQKSRPKLVSADWPPAPNVLTQLDMEKRVPKKEYQPLLERYQGRLYRLAQQARRKGVSTVLVFEGADAAGKGGVIQRLTAALDACTYQIIQVTAPTDEEHAQHYLWRFWRHLPRAGRVAIFDRSWYGRVLVERVEGFADEAAWQRAYGEINDFEKQLIDHGMVVAKYWIHIDKDEQLRRFKSRQATPHKRWKITDEDWRNREKWDEYEAAVDDMVARTHTPAAPWTLVEGNDKRFARLKVIETLCQQLEQALASG